MPPANHPQMIWVCIHSLIPAGVLCRQYVRDIELADHKNSEVKRMTSANIGGIRYSAFLSPYLIKLDTHTQTKACWCVFWDLTPTPKDLRGGLPTTATHEIQTNLHTGYGASTMAYTCLATVREKSDVCSPGRYSWMRQNLQKSRLPVGRLQHTTGERKIEVGHSEGGKRHSPADAFCPRKHWMEWCIWRRWPVGGKESGE